MRVHGSDDRDVRELIEHGAVSWRGPSPSARQALWMAEIGRSRRARAVRLATAGVGAVVLAAGSLTLLATYGSDSGVMRLVSHVLAGPPATPPATAPPPPESPSPSPSITASARPTPPRSTPQPTNRPHRPVPSPTDE